MFPSAEPSRDGGEGQATSGKFGKDGKSLRACRYVAHIPLDATLSGASVIWVQSVARNLSLRSAFICSPRTLFIRADGISEVSDSPARSGIPFVIARYPALLIAYISTLQKVAENLNVDASRGRCAATPVAYRLIRIHNKVNEGVCATAKIHYIIWEYCSRVVHSARR